MKQIYIVFLLFMVVISCVEKHKTEPIFSAPKVVEAKGYVVPKDSMAEPKVTVVDEAKLKKIPAGNPKVVPTNLNVHSAGNPKVVIAGNPRVIIPGTDTFSLPKVVLAIDSSFVAKQPKPISALPLRMKDAATFNIQYLDVDQGMNSSYVTSIIEDKSGNLWFGTIRGGVSKYDGKSFTHYTDKEGLSNNTIRAIIEDKNGNLWFGSIGGGVSKYDGKKFTNYTVNEGLSNNTIRAIIEDKNGNLWFGTIGGGVSKYDGKKFTHYTDKEGLSNNIVTSILEDKNGNLWFGTNGGGVSKYDGKKFTNYTVNEGLSNNAVRSIIEDKNGNLWFGTNGGGVNKYDGKSFTHYTEKEGLSNNAIWSILEDKSGNLWFGSNSGGLSKYDGKTFTHYTDKEGLSYNAIWSIIEDKNGNLWFGTNGGGVSKCDAKSFMHYTDKEGLSNNIVWSILEDKSGNLWFGTYGGGVIKYDGKSFTHYTDKEGLSHNDITSIIEDKNGNLWFGTNGGGVSKYDGKTFTHYTDKEGLSHNNITSIIEDKSGNLWFGTNGGGVSKYDGKSFTYYTDKEGLSSNQVKSILEDKNGNLWFGTNGGGVSKYDGKSFTHYTEKEGLSNNTVWTILEDKSGNLWFGTNGGGVSKYDGNRVEAIERGDKIAQRTQQDLKKINGKLVKSFRHYTNKEGLSNNTVWSILEDKSGNLWLTTEKGLNYFVVDGGGSSTKIVNPKILNLNKEDGLKAEDFFQNSVLLDCKNRIWLGSGKALTMLDLNDFKLNEKEPEIQLNNIYLRDNFVDYRNIQAEIKDSLIKNKELSKIKFTDVADFYNYPEKLELPNNLDHLTFHFSAVDWYAPHKLKYKYKLEGLDEDWSNLTSDNKADYRNIPFGKYTFKVKAIGSANKWSKTFEYTFVIRPPWWKTWWAITVWALITVGAIIFYIKWRERSLKQRQHELEQTVEERTAEVEEEKKIIEEQKHLIEEKHKEITDSINYAERIQRSFLATKELLDKNLKDYFVLFKPKDVVSGDFYWASKIVDANGIENFVLVTADSTGHGVPGAIMSLLNITSLEAAIKDGNTSPADILNATRKTIIERLKKDGSIEGGKDGMDASLISFDFKNNKLYHAAANNPVWIVRESELIELKPDKMPVGKHDKDSESFTQHEVELKKGDVVYTLTDGFPDQFGGDKGKKFMSKNLRELLQANSHLPMLEQKELLDNTFKNWVGDLEQIDDVTLVGIRV